MIFIFIELAEELDNVIDSHMNRWFKIAPTIGSSQNGTCLAKSIHALVACTPAVVRRARPGGAAAGVGAEAGARGAKGLKLFLSCNFRIFTCPHTPGSMMRLHPWWDFFEPPSCFASSLNRGCGVAEKKSKKFQTFGHG